MTGRSRTRMPVAWWTALAIAAAAGGVRALRRTGLAGPAPAVQRGDHQAPPAERGCDRDLAAGIGRAELRAARRLPQARPGKRQALRVEHLERPRCGRQQRQPLSQQVAAPRFVSGHPHAEPPDRAAERQPPQPVAPALAAFGLASVLTYTMMRKSRPAVPRLDRSAAAGRGAHGPPTARAVLRARGRGATALRDRSRLARVP